MTFDTTISLDVIIVFSAIFGLLWRLGDKIDEWRSELNGNFSGSRNEFKCDQAPLRDELKGDNAALRE